MNNRGAINMNKKLMIFALTTLTVLTFTGCSKQNKAVEELTPTDITEEYIEPIAPEIKNYLDSYINTNERPIAVMIDNDNKDARPQAGLDEAYLMYEMPVEGGATRFMVLFRNTNTEKIGPVRSSRHYFLDFVKENDAIYTHYGWSPKASQDISKFGVNNINGVSGAAGNVFWRERKFKGDWHSAYTSIERIKERASNRGYKSETDTKNEIKYSTEYINLPEENIATEITLPYAGMYKTGYKYNAETGLYEKQINNAPHTMQNGNVLSFKNIIVELIADKPLGDGSARREIITSGSGNGYYFTNGAFEEITWSKASRTEPTVYKKTDGEELLINPGNTIINIISPSLGVSIQ